MQLKLSDMSDTFQTALNGMNGSFDNDAFTVSAEMG